MNKNLRKIRINFISTKLDLAQGSDDYNFS